MRRFCLFCLVVVFFPYVATLACTGSLQGRGSERRGEGQAPSGKRVELDKKGLGYVDVEEYLIGAVARQMPADYEPEALRAQAIIARTFVYRQMEGREMVKESELNLEYLEEEQMEKLWGKPRFLEYYGNIRAAVEETRGKAMTYQGDYIEPLFHRASAGQTRAGDEAHPYLASVDSREDMEAEGYLTVTAWTVEEFLALVGTLPSGERVRPEQIPDSIQVIGRDEAGYVTGIQIGAHSFEGESVRSALKLPSPAYTLEGYAEGVRAICRGQGHGYGMSQYGAHKKAEGGMGAEEILAYYYPDIKIIYPKE